MRWFRRVVVGGSAAVALAATAAEVRIVGSDLLGPEFPATVYSGARQVGTAVLIAFDGSRPGLGRLKSNWADMGLLTLPADEAAQLTAFHVETLAYHCVWVLVAEECPLQQISLPELAAVFGASSAKPLRGWRDLGVASGAWSEKPIEAFAPETGAGLMLEYFRNVVMAGAALRPEVVRYRDAQELGARFKREPHAIALAATKPEDAKLRPLAISVRANGPAIALSAAALQRGDYPLRLPLQLVLQKERKEALWAWIAWWRSDEATRAFERAGLVAAPRPE